MTSKFLGVLGAVALLSASAFLASAAIVPLPSSPLIGKAFISGASMSSDPYLFHSAFQLTQSGDLASGSTPLPIVLASHDLGSGANALLALQEIPSAASHNGSPAGEPMPSPILAAGGYALETKGKFIPEVADAALGINGAVRVSALSELSSWAMMLLGFAALGFAGYRSRRSLDLAA